MAKDPSSEMPFRQWSAPLWPLLRPFRTKLFWAFVAMFLDAFLTALRPWPLKVVIDLVLSHRHTRVPFIGHWLNNTEIEPMHAVYGACAATLLIAISTGVLTYYFTSTLGNIGQRFVFSLRCQLFAHMQRLSLKFHDRQRTGDLVARLTSDISAIQQAIANGTVIVGSNGLLIIGMISLMLWLNWQFTLAALAVAPLLFWVVFIYTRRINQASREARNSDGRLASVAQETLASIRIVQGLAQEQQQDERFFTQGSSSLDASLEEVRYRARVAPLVDVLAAVGLAIVMWYGAKRVMAGELTAGDVVVFFAYVTNLYSPMRALSRFSFGFNKARVGAERIAKVFEVRSDVADRPDARAAKPLKGEIEFKNVTFKYDTGQPALSEINLRIRAGEKVAIVGATGAGKSTLVSFVPRFFDPTSGSVWIDGEDIRNYQLQSLRDQVGLVLQDSLLFKGTIRENIAFGRPDATDKEIVAAATVANADEFIRQKPLGYETSVSERATTLSGGQKQRIAIARAILRNAPILILDEPTSGLDAEAERTVMDSLAAAANGRTTLIIAHRLTTVRFADRIILLDAGRIVEEGTHAELLAVKGKYAHFCRLQSLP